VQQCGQDAVVKIGKQVSNSNVITGACFAAVAVIEMRIPQYAGRKGNVFSGYFDDLDAFVRGPAGWWRSLCTAWRKAAGLYFTMNPVKPELLARKDVVSGAASRSPSVVVLGLCLRTAQR
jgi:hypothetical protein